MNSKHITHITAAIKLLNEHADEDFVSKAQAINAADNLQSIISDLENSTKSPIKQVIDDILNEVDRAENKHPNWPTDAIYAASIVSEEEGELMQASVQYVLEGGKLDNIRTEAIHTAATCIRLIKNLNP